MSVEEERKAAKKKAEDSILCKAQSKKKTQNAKKEADEIDKEAYQDNIITDREGNHDGKSKDINLK